MPYARISLLQGKQPEYLRALSDNLHRALVDSFEVPLSDRFQIIHQLAPNELIFDETYLGGPRSRHFVFISITAGRPRSTSVKQEFYRRLVDLLSKSPGIRPEDVMVVIQTNQLDEWSFGSGNVSMIPNTSKQDEASREKTETGTGVIREELFRQTLSKTITGIEAYQITFGPGQTGARHLHPCPVIGYIVEGSAVMEIEGQSPQQLPAGSVFYEPAETIIARFDNASAEMPMMFVAYYLMEGKQNLIEMLPDA